MAGKSLPVSPSFQDVGRACGKDEWSSVRTSKKTRRTLNCEVEQGVPGTIVIRETTFSFKTLVAELAKRARYALTIHKHNHVGNKPCRSTHWFGTHYGLQALSRDRDDKYGWQVERRRGRGGEKEAAGRKDNLQSSFSRRRNALTGQKDNWHGAFYNIHCGVGTWRPEQLHHLNLRWDGKGLRKSLGEPEDWYEPVAGPDERASRAPGNHWGLNRFPIRDDWMEWRLLGIGFRQAPG